MAEKGFPTRDPRPGYKWVQCTTCNGTGEIISGWSAGADSRKIRCPSCFRLGWVQLSSGLLREKLKPQHKREEPSPKPKSPVSEEEPSPRKQDDKGGESRPGLSPEKQRKPIRAGLPNPRQPQPSTHPPTSLETSLRPAPPSGKPPRPPRSQPPSDWEPQKPSNPWPWIIGGLAVMLLLTTFILLTSEFEGDTPTRTSRASPTPTPTRTAESTPKPTLTRIATPSPTRSYPTATPRPAPRRAPTAMPSPTRVSTPTSPSTPVPTPVATPARTPYPLPTRIPEDTPIPTPLPTPVATLVPTPVPTPTPTPTPLEELRQYTLELINADRVKFGVSPVVLGTNVAAQSHAEDMVAHSYGGHWWTNGMKPYMVYAVTGGKSYVAENSSWSGWPDDQWKAENCDSFLVRCHVPSPREAVEELHWSMMYDDADSDWGHRDNILDEGHRAVNIGIASNGRMVAFVQHFEGGDVQAAGPPTLSRNGTFTLTVTKNGQDIRIGRVATIYYDPLPVPMTPREIDALDSYCIGGGATTRCGDPVVRILPPPGPNRYYSNLEANTVVADDWAEDDHSFQVVANIAYLVTKPGVYTVVLWKDSGTNQFNERLLMLSLLPEQ